MQEKPLSLRDEAIALYVGRPAYIKPSEVAEAIGRTSEWLRLFSKGKLADPGVVTVEKLVAYINERTSKGE